jgi:peptidoglycan/LPS O-acetylase OafA/YrhL
MTSDLRAKPQLKSLTSLRFVAAFYVFLFHVNNRAPMFGEGILGNFIAEGAVGMTIFFVLSGFILSHAYDAVDFDLRQYFWNRVARIYPIYFLAAVLALPWLARDVLQESSLTNPFFAIVAGIILLVTGLFMLQAWLPQTFAFWNNSSSWSISTEAFFYSVFPLSRTVSSMLQKRQLLLFLCLLCMLSAIVPTSAIIFSNSPDSFSLFYASPIFRLPEFLAGVISYRLVCDLHFNNKLRYFFLAVLTAAVLHVALLGNALPGYTLHNWIAIPGVSASLALLYDASRRGSGFFENAVFVWLGKISYCFYSFQFHVLEGFRWIAPPATIGALTYTVLATTTLLLVSALTYHFVEEPARIWIRKRVPGTSRIVGET